MDDFEWSYLGAGVLSLGPRDNSAGILKVGNCEALNFDPTEEVKKLKNFMSCAGGLRASTRTVEEINFKAVLTDLTSNNLALAYLGLKSSYAGEDIGSGTLASATAYHGGLIYVPGITPTSVVVKDDSETTTYVKDNDYEVSAAGIRILSSGNIADGATIKYSLSTGPSNKIETLTDIGTERVAIFEGMNRHMSCAKVNIKAHKVILGPASGFAWVGDDYSKLEINGSLLADTSIIADGLSQFMRIDMPATV